MKIAHVDDEEIRLSNGIVIRFGVVYGPGDRLVSELLKMVRTLPVVPVRDGDAEVRLVWHEDLAKVLAAAADREDLRGETLDATSETTTINEVLDRLAEITDRRFARVPIPASHVAPSIHDGRSAFEVLGIAPTPLGEGLRKLADALPEVLPEEGFGSMEHKRVWADIGGTRHTAASLLAIFRERTNDVMPIEFAAEPGVPEKVEQGATMTGRIPMRGNVQVRVERDEPTRIVFGTVDGHPLAGIVVFLTSEHGATVRFMVETWTRASNVLDWIGLHAFGRFAQTVNWRIVVERMIDFSGGTSDGVYEEAEKLDEADRAHAEQSIRELVQTRRREEVSAAAERPAQR